MISWLQHAFVEREGALYSNRSRSTSGLSLVISGDLHSFWASSFHIWKYCLFLGLLKGSAGSVDGKCLRHISCQGNFTLATFTFIWAWGEIFWMCLNDYRISFFYLQRIILKINARKHIYYLKNTCLNYLIWWCTYVTIILARNYANHNSLTYSFIYGCLHLFNKLLLGLF